MSRLLKLIMFVAVISAASCSVFDDSEIWDHIRDLESRVSRLEELCKEMNTNISSLKTIVNALENNDFITHITPVTKNGKTIGYTISFSNSDSITIYNGEDGNTPQIGVKQGSDGVYYWTLDGEWLTDSEGNRIRAIAHDGKDGEDGKDGKDGEVGNTPILKIEEGFWFISYDNGKSWTKLGKATGDQGESGDSMFISVDTSDPYYIIFTLQDGSQIKIPTWYAFDELQRMCTENNINIKALQTIIASLENNDYIKSITSLRENGEEIGYIITFAKSGNITIYHGKNGKDGQDGKDGEDGINGISSIVGVMPDTDGVYYWTLNGEWLRDENGNKIPVTGKNGQDGENGKDAITPQFKIQYGYWYISYDNGKTWQQLGKATGNDGYDGADGQDGKDGIIVDVIDSANEVIFILGNGLVITIPKAKKDINMDDIIQFDDPLVKSICIERWDTNGDQELSYREASEVYYTDDAFRSQPIERFNEFQYFTNITSLYCDFQSCEYLTSIVIPENVSTLWYTFNGCYSLTSIYLPDSIEYIVDNNPFSDCQNLSNFYGKFSSSDHRCLISDGLLISFAPAGLTSYRIPYGVNRIGEGVFEYCYELSEVIIPETVTSIGRYAFSNWNISSINFPSSLREIGERAFAGLRATEIELPYGLETIGNGAFDCCAFYQIDIPSTVISVGSSAFSSNSNLTSITIPSTITSIGDNVVSGCSSLQSIYGDYASEDNRCLIIDGKLNSFAPYGLTSYTIPDYVTSISPYAFYGCKNLTSIIIPEGVESIGNSAFSGCSKLPSIRIPNKITRIESNSFYGCSNLEEVIFEGDITSIKSYAFDSCKKLKSVTLPESLLELGHGSFRSCTSLEEVFCKATTPPSCPGWSSIEQYAFYKNAANRKIYVPMSSASDYKSANGWSNFAADIEGVNF